jgi:2-keto-4-pentenoate hydratase/2-oxohepta-3-ene-1,7-dioic acid hydratase in catechol pathway
MHCATRSIHDEGAELEMKLVTFAISGPLGVQRRLGAALDDKRIVDLTSAHATYLAQRTDEPTPRELAALRTPPDLIGWLRGQHKSREAAEQALAFARDLNSDSRGLDDARLVFERSEVKLLAPAPRPNSLRDFSIFEEHMSRAEGGGIPKRPTWYRWPPYYKGNPDSIIGPEDPIPFPYYSDKLDLELEIGIIVGKGGRNLSLDQAKQAIAGYTILIDCRISVDGEVWFEGNTSAPRSFLAHHLVAYASDTETLQPGDLLGTGTVSYSCSVDLHMWPQVGQRVKFEVGGIGVLEHTIVAGDRGPGYVRNGMDGLLQAPRELVAV